MIGREDDVREVFYFTHTVRPRNQPPQKTVKAWSWDEDVAKAYGEFHNSKNLVLNHYIGTIGEICDMMEEFQKCQIKLAQLKTRDPHNHDRCILVWAPVTDEEMELIQAHVRTCCTDFVTNYKAITEVFYRLKDKYQDALRVLFFEEFMRKALQRTSMIAERVSFDEIKILVHEYPDDFGD